MLYETAFPISADKPAYKWPYMSRLSFDFCSRHQTFNRRISEVLICAIILTIAVGCGRQTGPKRISIQGKVEVMENPLMDGTITFLPTDGHQGPASNGVIENGEYQIPTAEGPTVGPHMVIISFIPGKSEMSRGKPLRTRWEVKTEIDDKGSNQDFSLKNED